VKRALPAQLQEVFPGVRLQANLHFHVLYRHFKFVRKIAWLSGTGSEVWIAGQPFVPTLFFLLDSRRSSDF